ncbi:MAG: aminotransferase class V-fold PLP-dependent enzyme [Candidatus Omnitrophota bacterium]
MKTVCILIDQLHSLSGGTERQVFELCKNVDKARYRLLIVSHSDKGGLLGDIKNLGIETHSLKIKRIYDFSAIVKGFKFIRFLKAEKVDVLMTYHFSSDIFGTFWGRLSGVRRIISNRRDLGFWRKKHHNFSYKVINRFVDKIICVSKAVKEKVVAFEGVPCEKIKVIYGGVNLEAFSERDSKEVCRQNLTLYARAPVVGIVSWLRPEKGVDDFLRAVKIIKKILPQTQFVIAGDGPLKSKLIALACELGVVGHVRFLGWRLDTQQVMRACDIIVSSSKTEGFSNVLIEAMAMAKAVVATDVGGNREAVIEGKTGFLVEPNNPQALADKVVYLLENNNQLILMGKAGALRAQNEFNIKNSVKKLEDFLDDTIFDKKNIYITAFPPISAGLIFRNFFRKIENNPGTDKTIYTYSGSCAIYRALKAVKTKDADVILMPAYHCGIEVEMAHRAGFGVEFYNIKSNGSIDIDDIKQKINDNTKAIFVIHYFGFLEPLDCIKEICSRYNLILIEDCAHYLSRQNNPSLFKGDFQIFSYLKTLPVADGGALIISNPSFSLVPFGAGCSRTLVLRNILLSLNKYFHFKHKALSGFFHILIIAPLRLCFKIIKKLSQSKTIKMLKEKNSQFYTEISGNSISTLSLNIINTLDIKDAVDKRRMNFKILVNELKNEQNLKPLYESLPDSAVPLFFPLLVNNRDKLRESLKSRGIETFIFGASLNKAAGEGNYPSALMLSKENLCLPVHQGLNSRHMEYIAHALKQELKKLNRKTRNIAHLISASGLYGAEKVALSLSAHLNDNGTKIWMGVINNHHSPNFEAIEEAKRQGIPVFSVDSKGRFDLSCIRELENFIKDNDIDILHTHNYKANIIGLIAARKTGVRVVATIHGYTGKGFKLKLYEAFDKFITRFFDKVVFVDESSNNLYKRDLPRMHLIPNGIKVDKHSRTEKSETESLVVGTVGRLSPEKGHKYLIEGFSMIASKYLNARLIIVGAGIALEDLKKLSAALGIRDKVDFTGFIRNTSDYYKKFDFYVSSSLSENSPLAVLEAMSFEKPIVATAVGGVSKLIGDNQRGILVKPRSSFDIAKALRLLIEDVTLREKVSANAKSFVSENHSLEKMVNSYRSVYAEVC